MILKNGELNRFCEDYKKSQKKPYLHENESKKDADFNINILLLPI